jgi:hypothetical protein
VLGAGRGALARVLQNLHTHTRTTQFFTRRRICVGVLE